MFKTKLHISDSITKRQYGRTVLDIAATGPGIPLRTVDWAMQWCTFPTKSEEYFKKIYEFEVRKDDVYVVTFPKAGTTWLQEVTWLLTHDLDYATAISEDLTSRSPYLDLTAMYTELSHNNLELAQALTSPRVLKTHFPAHLIPKQIWDKKAKIIYCARNPKDTAVSFYHFHLGLGTWQGNINEFVEDYINNDIMYTPYWDHLMAFWQMRHEENIFFTTFEELKKDLAGVILKLNRFLGKPELVKENLKKLLEHLAFDNLKANPRVNLTHHIKSLELPMVKPNLECFRRGIVGSYKDELSLDSQNKLDAWTENNLKKYNIQHEDIFGKI